LFSPSRLIQSTVAVCSIWAFSILGGGVGLGIVCRNASSKRTAITVLKAAPLSTREIDPAALKRCILNAPPLYSKTTSVNWQSVQSNPSSGWITPFRAKFERALVRGGTTGMAPGNATARAWAAKTKGCVIVDVWLPENAKNTDVIRTPEQNDPDAKMILRIDPPLHRFKKTQRNCTLYRYHYGLPLPGTNSEVLSIPRRDL